MAIYKNSPPIVTSGLVLQLDAANKISYPTTGTTWTDLSGLNNNGTLVNSPTFSSNGGGSIVFNGVNNTCTLTATPTSLGMIGGDFSVNVWINNNGTTKGGLVSSNTSSTPGGQYAFIISSANVVQVNYYGGGSVQISGILSNTWYMFTHTYNYTTKSSKLYRNGLLVASSTLTVDLTTTAPIIIGFYGFGGGYFNGSIPLTQIYNRELSVLEVVQNYNALKSRFGLS